MTSPYDWGGGEKKRGGGLGAVYDTERGPTEKVRWPIEKVKPFVRQSLRELRQKPEGIVVCLSIFRILPPVPRGLQIIRRTCS